MAMTPEEFQAALQSAATPAPAQQQSGNVDAFAQKLRVAAEELQRAGGPPPAPTAPAPDPALQIPTGSDINASMERMQRMEAFRNYAEHLHATVGQPAQPRESNLAERVLAPFENVGGAIGSALQRPLADVSDPTTQQVLGARPGVPFDAKSGASFMERLAMQFTLNKAETAYALMAGNPAVQDVRFNQMGEPIVTVKDAQTGKVRDILANPVGLDVGDFAFALANLPQMFGGGLAARGMAPEALQGASALAHSFLSSKNIVPTAARAALGGEAAGLGTDLMMRGDMLYRHGMLPNGVDVEHTAAKRGEMAMADFLFGAGVGAAAKLGTRVVTPFGNRGPLQMKAEAAAQTWRDVGVDYRPTPGEATGAPILQRSEAYASRKPGSSAVFDTLEGAQRDELQKAQRILLGVDPTAVPPADLVGTRALGELRQNLTPLDYEVDRTTQQVLHNVDAELKANIGAATGIPDNVAQTAVGQRLFTGAESRLQDFRDQSQKLYDAVYQSPLVAGQGRNIDATPLATQAKDILGRTASVEKPTGTEPLTAFVDSSTRSKLQQLADAAGGKVSLKDLIELRRDVDDDLFRGSALGSIPERRLSEIRDALTARIKGGLDELDQSGALRKSWEAANQHYADNIAKFKQLDILPMFKDQQQRGALDLYDVVQKAFRDPGKWTAYRDFYGPASDEMNQLRRAYADSLVGRTIGSDTVDAGGFATRLADAYSNDKQADIVRDVFGTRLNAIKEIADAGAAVAKGNVNAGELADAMRNGTLTKTSLRALQAAQAAREDTYRNALLEQARKGDFRAEPSKFVDNVVFGRNSEPEDVRDLLTRISDPAVRDEIRQRTVLRILQEATAGPTGKERIRASLIGRFTDDESGNMVGSRVRAVMGDEDFNRLRALADMTAPSDVAQGMFKAAGGISGGMAISHLEQHLLGPGMVGEVGGILKSYMMALGYKWGPVRAYIGNNALGAKGTVADRAAFVNALMSGAPVLQDMFTIFGHEHMRTLSIQLKNAIDSDLRSGQQSNTNAPATR